MGQFSHLLYLAQNFVFFVLSLVVFGICVWALVDAALRPAHAFTMEGKKTKTIWLALTGLAAVLAFLGLPTSIYRGSGSMFTVILLIPAGIYLTDVRPAIRGYKKPPRGSSDRPRGPRDW